MHRVIRNGHCSVDRRSLWIETADYLSHVREMPIETSLPANKSNIILLVTLKKTSAVKGLLVRFFLISGFQPTTNYLKSNILIITDF